jgi:hypothetical protein
MAPVIEVTMLRMKSWLVHEQIIQLAVVHFKDFKYFPGLTLSSFTVSPMRELIVEFLGHLFRREIGDVFGSNQPLAFVNYYLPQSHSELLVGTPSRPSFKFSAIQCGTQTLQAKSGWL